MEREVKESQNQVVCSEIWILATVQAIRYDFLQRRPRFNPRAVPVRCVVGQAFLIVFQFSLIMTHTHLLLVLYSMHSLSSPNPSYPCAVHCPNNAR